MAALARQLPRLLKLDVVSQDVVYTVVGIQDQMLMEKLKSWNALSNFPTATATAAGENFLKRRWCPGLSREHPSGAKARSSSRVYRHG
jgi:hypothetical protein